MNALIIVDMQRDFIDGTLAVDEGADIITPIAQEAVAVLVGTSTPVYDLVVTTADAHPEETVHFDKWPVHCVAGTPGADLADGIEAVSDVHIAKGDHDADDGYSGFEGRTDDGHTLADVLHADGITDVTVVGLALDYCVKATALDAVKAGFKTTVPLALTRAVSAETGAEVIDELREAGVTVS